MVHKIEFPPSLCNHSSVLFYILHMIILHLHCPIRMEGVFASCTCNMWHIISNHINTPPVFFQNFEYYIRHDTLIVYSKLFQTFNYVSFNLWWICNSISCFPNLPKIYNKNRIIIKKNTPLKS